jgi:hypothetical protein
VLNVAGNREVEVLEGQKNPMMFIARWIVGTALQILDVDYLLIKRA